MKWPNESLRVQAYKLKKADPTITDEIIYDRFVKEKKIIAPVNSTPTPIVTPADLGFRHNHPSATGNEGKQLPEPMEITETYAEQFLISCAQSNPGDPKVAALLIQWLDKKKALEPKVNLDEQSSSITEYKEIREQFYGRTTACRDAATD